jgi:DNA-binding CsgD family transcriptional regulator
MSIQTRTSRPSLDVRRPFAMVSHDPQRSRPLRRAERALVDGIQSVVRNRQTLSILVAVDYPGPAFNYDLPAIRVDAPLIPSRYGLVAQLLTAVSKSPEARAAVRAAAHSLGLSSGADHGDGASHGAKPVDLIEAVRQVIEQLAEDVPFVIQFDNLHRADAASLTLLRELSSHFEPQSILFVGLYRADQPFPAELGTWLNVPTVIRAAFSPVWTDDVAVLLDDLFGRKTPLNTMIDIAKNSERLLLLGGIPLLEACCRNGRWTDGLTLSERVITLAQASGAEYILAAARVVRSQILLGLGQWVEAQTECDLVINSPVCARDNNLAAAALWGGYKARSMANQPARHLMDALRRWRAQARTSHDAGAVAPIMADMIVHLAESDQLGDARAWQRDLETLLEVTGHPIAKLAVSIGQGTILARSGNWRATIGAYRAAAQHAASIHELLYEARANSGLALSLLELGDTESKNEGRERLSLAHSVLSRLNARPDMERCEAGAKQFGLRPRQRRASAANRTPGALTRREREVLALVVNGLTNRQIAQRLTISEKTAEGHVGNILAKLSVSSRVKAAELARATGLLEGGAA